MKRALIVKMWALGDILMATPLISALRGTYPDIHITWVVDESHGDLLKGHPDINELIILHSGQWRRMLRNANVPAWLKRSLEIRRDMAARNFDVAINCHPDKWWTTFLCAAPIRVGLYPSLTLPWSRRFYTHALNRPEGIHNTDHYLTTTRVLGIPDGSKQMLLGETPEEKPFVAEFYARHHLTAGRPVVILAPFTTAENKCWEPERFAQTADRLSECYNAQLILTMGPRDAEKARAIAYQAKAPLVLAEGTTLRQYAGLIRAADLVISGDSSPMHLAAAVGTPYLTLFGPTLDTELYPLAGKGRILRHPLPCAPCGSTHCHNPIFRECLKRITVEDVVTAAESLLTRKK